MSKPDHVNSQAHEADWTIDVPRPSVRPTRQTRLTCLACPTWRGRPTDQAHPAHSADCATA